jgi:hypothetical protein
MNDIKYSSKPGRAERAKREDMPLLSEILRISDNTGNIKKNGKFHSSII